MKECQKGGWRYIEDDNVSASFGLAADEYLVNTFSPEASPYTGVLRLYTYKSHCALVGRFQEIERELNLDECRDRGIGVNRRLTGGGAILMGEDQLGVAVISPITEGSYLTQSQRLFETYSKGITFGLKRLGIDAEFRPKNDMLVNNKKVAGLALFTGANDNVLFHASILLDIDLSLMLSALNISQDKLSGKGIDLPEQRVTTVSSELGRKTSIQELRKVIRLGFHDALDAEFKHEPFAVDEIVAIKKLEERKYNTNDWIYNGIDEE